MTGEQQHISILTSGQLGQTVRHSSLRNKKIKTPPPHKKNKILLPTHIAHICLPPLTQANACGSQKSAISHRFIHPRIMSDVHDKETRSCNMSRIKGKDTKPEIQVRKFLFANGFRYKLHDKKLPGKPDIVLLKLQTVILFTVAFGMDMITADTLLFRKHGQSFGLTRLRATNKETWKTFLNLERRAGKFLPSLNVRLKEINK